MNEREAQIFDDVISGLKDYHWPLQIGTVVDSLRTDFRVDDTGNAQADYERARDWVEARLNHIGVSALEVIQEHQKRTGEDDHAIVDRLIRFHDNYNSPSELWEMLTV